MFSLDWSILPKELKSFHDKLKKSVTSKTKKLKKSTEKAIKTVDLKKIIEFDVIDLNENTFWVQNVIQ